MSSRHQTRAFLFADLREYSAYTERRGDDAARALLRRYRRLVRDEIAHHGGAEIRTEGDSFYVVFGSVADAVLAGLAITEAAAAASAETPSDPIHVGIGIHAGETVDDDDEGIVSSAVNVAARVCAAAAPGELLVTDTVRALTRTALAITFVPRGRRRLKGIAEPVALYRVASGAASPGARRVEIPVLIAAGSVLALALIVASRIAPDPATSADGMTRTPTPLSTPSAPLESAGDLTRFQDAGEFPNAGERELLDLLLSDVAAGCERADPADTPEFRFTTDDAGFTAPRAMFVRAGLNCFTAGTRVYYWQASGSAGTVGFATDLFFNVVQRLSLAPGSCATQSRVYGSWQAGNHSGQVLCYVSVDGDAVIEWTFDERNIYAVARRRDGSSALYEWWRDAGRLLGR